MTGCRPFTTMSSRAHVEALRGLRELVAAEGVRDRESFHDLMEAAFGHGRLDMRRMSDDLGYAVTTVRRWARGCGAPHPALWAGVVGWVTGAIDAAVGETEAAPARPWVA